MLVLVLVLVGVSRLVLANMMDMVRSWWSGVWSTSRHGAGRDRPGGVQEGVPRLDGVERRNLCSGVPAAAARGGVRGGLRRQPAAGAACSAVRRPPPAVRRVTGCP